MAIRALLFDFDGLLVDTELAGYKAWQAIYEELGGHLDFDQWCRNVLSHGEHADYANEVDAFAGAQDWTDLHKRRRAIRNGFCLPLPGVCELLARACAAGLRLGVVSNSPSTWVNERMAATDVSQTRFDLVITSDDGFAAKPAPDAYEGALAALGIKTHEAIVFEDSPRGVLAARSAGLYCVAVPNPVTESGDFCSAAEVVKSLVDIDLGQLIGRAEIASSALAAD